MVVAGGADQRRAKGAGGKMSSDKVMLCVILIVIAGAGARVFTGKMSAYVAVTFALFVLLIIGDGIVTAITALPGPRRKE